MFPSHSTCESRYFFAAKDSLQFSPSTGLFLWFYRLWQHTCELTDVKLLSFSCLNRSLDSTVKKAYDSCLLSPSIRGWRDPRSLICLFWTCGLALSSHICTYLDNASVRIGEILESEMELNNSHDKYSAAVKNQVGRVPKEYRGSFISS